MTNDVQYTTVDLNATGATTIYDPDHDATVYAVHLNNSGSAAEIHLEVTDGSSTVDLSTAQTGGDELSYTDPIPLDGDSDLQINVTAAEGAALTSDAAVFVGS